MLIVIGVTADGRKDLLAMEEGYRESTASWAGVLRGLRDRGLLEAPLLAVGDGALGLWGGLNQVFPSTRHRRRWNLRRLNVLDKLPRRLHAETSKQLHALYTALTRAECTQLRAALCQQLRLQGQADAAACLERDWEDFVAFYDFPEEHWTHLRTSNPIEGIFAGVRLRTNAAKRDQKPQPAAPADRRRAIHRRQAATSTEHGGCRRVAHLSGLPWKKFLKT